MACVCLASCDVGIAAPPNRWELGIEGGFFLPDEDLSGKPEKASEVENLAGLRGGYLFAGNWGWFLDAATSDINTNTPGEDADTVRYRTGIEWFSRKHDTRLQWFVAAGVSVAVIAAILWGQIRDTAEEPITPPEAP